MDEKLGAIKKVSQEAKEVRETQELKEVEETESALVTPAEAPVTVADTLISEILVRLRPQMIQMRPLTPLPPRKELLEDVDSDAEPDFDFEALGEMPEITQAESCSVLRASS